MIYIITYINKFYQQNLGSQGLFYYEYKILYDYYVVKYLDK